MRFQPKHIATKLIGGTLCVLCLVMLVSSKRLISQGKEALFQQIDAQGVSVAEAASVSCVEPMLLNDYPVLETFAQLLAKERNGIRFVRIERNDGTVMAEHPASEGAQTNQGPQVKIYTADIKTAPPDRSRLGKVIVGISTDRAEAMVREHTRSFMTTSIISFVALALLLFTMLKWIVTNPLRALDGHAQSLGEGDLESPIVVHSRDEMGRLSQSLDHMRRNLKASYMSIRTQNEELKECDRLKDEFLANITHELKTPLNGIVGLGQAVLQGDYGQLDSRFTQPMKMIERSGQRLVELCSQILTFSEHQNALPLVNTQTIGLADYLRRLLEQHEYLFVQKGLECRCEVPEDMQLETDPSVLDHVFTNLLTNAVKFTPSGWISVNAEALEDDVIAVTVQDTGIGIAPEMHSAIFERFRQGFASDNREYEGSGIGLPIVQQAVDRLGGRIHLVSDLGCGAQFTVFLHKTGEAVTERFVNRWQAEHKPVATPIMAHHPNPSAEPEPESSESEQTDAPAVNPHVETILVVDDDEINREVVCSFLQRFDINVLQAENGQEALDFVANRRIDMVLLDLMMPEMSGYEVLEKLQAMDLEVKPPVLVLSAKNQAYAITKAFKCGAIDYISKPFHRDELMARIRNHLQLKLQREGLAKALRDAEQARQNKVGVLANIEKEIQEPMRGVLRKLHGVLGNNDHEDLRPKLMEAIQSVEVLLRTTTELFDCPQPAPEPLENTGQAAEAYSQQDHYSGQVLLVDDQVSHQIETKGILQDLGFRVDVAQNGKEAVQLVHYNQYELILMKMDLPELDGHTAVAQMKTQGITAPVIGMIQQQEDRRRCIQSGCTGATTIPVKQSALESIMHAIFSDEVLP